MIPAMRRINARLFGIGNSPSKSTGGAAWWTPCVQYTSLCASSALRKILSDYSVGTNEAGSNLGTANMNWREHPLLKSRFHPEFPDDLQVIVHDGGPRLSSTLQN